MNLARGVTLFDDTDRAPDLSLTGSATLPGGARLTFREYLPARTCPQCRRVRPAAEYVKTWVPVSGKRVLLFGLTCVRCDPPTKPFREFQGMRVRTSYVDDTGHLVGWHQRDARGRFGKVQPLETMTFRCDRGLWSPQPKIDRHANPHRPRFEKPHAGDIRDPRRTFTMVETGAALDRQHRRCAYCDLEFLGGDSIEGDHRIAWARGGPTNSENCQAVHARCNAEKGHR